MRKRIWLAGLIICCLILFYSVALSEIDKIDVSYLENRIGFSYDDAKKEDWTYYTYALTRGANGENVQIYLLSWGKGDKLVDRPELRFIVWDDDKQLAIRKATLMIGNNLFEMNVSELSLKNVVGAFVALVWSDDDFIKSLADGKECKAILECEDKVVQAVFTEEDMLAIKGCAVDMLRFNFTRNVDSDGDPNKIFGDYYQSSITAHVFEKLDEAQILAANPMVDTKERVLTHAEYLAAANDDEVIIESYVQDHQSWWDNKITVYLQSEDGAYFVYEMACSEEDSRKLVPGTKIRVRGYKGEWAGEVEIMDAKFEFVEADPWIAEPTDVTAMLSSDKIKSHMNEFVAVKGAKVVAQMDGAAFNYKNTEGKTDDLYFDVEVNGKTYSCCVEFYLRGKDSDVYKAVEGLKVGDVVDFEGFLYWYNGPNIQATNLSVKKSSNMSSITQSSSSDSSSSFSTVYGVRFGMTPQEVQDIESRNNNVSTGTFESADSYQLYYDKDIKFYALECMRMEYDFDVVDHLLYQIYYVANGGRSDYMYFKSLLTAWYGSPEKDLLDTGKYSLLYEKKGKGDGHIDVAHWIKPESHLGIDLWYKNSDTVFVSFYDMSNPASYGTVPKYYTDETGISFSYLDGWDVMPFIIAPLKIVFTLREDFLSSIQYMQLDLWEETKESFEAIGLKREDIGENILSDEFIASIIQPIVPQNLRKIKPNSVSFSMFDYQTDNDGKTESISCTIALTVRDGYAHMFQLTSADKRDELVPAFEQLLQSVEFIK